MTVLQIKKAVEKSCVGFKRSEINALQMYFISFYFPYYSHSQIASILHYERSMVCHTVKRIISSEYDLIRERVFSSLIIQGKRPGYKWIKK